MRSGRIPVTGAASGISLHKASPLESTRNYAFFHDALTIPQVKAFFLNIMLQSQPYAEGSQI